MSYFDDVMPAITSLSPSEGPEIGGTRVFIISTFLSFEGDLISPNYIAWCMGAWRAKGGSLSLSHLSLSPTQTQTPLTP